MYAGRASASSYIDLFITLLSMGLNGYKNLLKERNRLLVIFQKGLEAVAQKHNERFLVCPRNTISFGVTLNQLGTLTTYCREEDTATQGEPSSSKDINLSEEDVAKATSYFGSMLFTRCVSGARVISKGQVGKIGNAVFYGYGSSTNEYGSSYMTAACAIGLTELEITAFFDRLDKAFIDFHKQKLQVEDPKPSIDLGERILL
jgi:O-phospho-L-seryl-tRNASec:L-selenocysteinyl-tRNA synthase